MIAIDDIRDYIRHDILNDPEASIAPDEDLLLSGLLDSLGVMRLVSHLESSCALAIPPEDVVLEHFGTLNRIHDYLSSREPR